MGFNISSFNQQLFAYSVSSGVTPTPPGPSQEHDIEGTASASFNLTYNDSTIITITPGSNNKWYYDFPSGTTLTSFANMFGSASHLHTVSFKNTLDTSTVTNMSYMFSNCVELDTVNLSYLDTSNVTDMSYMFESTYLLSLDLTNFDTSKVTSMSGMFRWCEHLSSINLSSFDTSNVTYMSNMFAYCRALTTLDLSNFDTSKVTDMSSMFDNCGVTSLDVTSFNTNLVTNMFNMFCRCDKLSSLDLTSFKTTQVTSYNNMLSRNSSASVMMTVYYVPANWNSSIVSSFTTKISWVAV